MGEEQVGVMRVSAIRTEIEEIRDDLGTYISELDRRRHEALDFRLQLRRHRDLVLSVGVGLAAIAGALVAWRMRKPREPLSLAARINERIDESLTARVKDRVRKHDLLDSLGRAMIAVAAAGGVALVKSLVDRRRSRTDEA